MGARRQLAVQARGVAGAVHGFVEAGPVVALRVTEALKRRQRDRVARRDVEGAAGLMLAPSAGPASRRAAFAALDRLEIEQLVLLGEETNRSQVAQFAGATDQVP